MEREMMKLPEAFPDGTVVAVAGGSKMISPGMGGNLAVLILDESGSMASQRNDTIGGVRSFVENLADGTLVTIVNFSYHSRNVVVTRPKGSFSFGPGDYNPSGGTALNDALCSTILRTNDHLASLPANERPSVVFCVVTDGEENSSSKFSTEAARKMVGECKDAGWGFTFLGADIDSFQSGAQYTFSAQATANVSKANIGVGLRSASAFANRFGSTYANSLASGDTIHQVRANCDAVGYTDEERTKMGGGHDKR